MLDDLTRLPEKARLYAEETWFRDAWAVLAEDVDEPAVLAERHAILMIKPDAIAARAVTDVLASARESGFVPAAVRPIRLSRHVLRALWLFKFNIATVERMLITDLIHDQCANLVVLVRDERPEAGLPASLRLTSWKGPSNPERRRPGQLRSRIPIQNRLLSRVHTSDEPADVVRELGIFLARDELRRLAAEARGGGDAEAETHALTERLYDAVPAHDLRLETAVPRVGETAERLGAERPVEERPRWMAVARACESVATARAAGWDALAPIAHDDAVAAFDAWDVITIGSHLAPQDIPGRTRALGDAEPDLWLRPSPL